MTNKNFYDIVDSESTALAVVFENNTHFKKRDENGKKSFLFLLWFLKNYLPESDLLSLEEFITEGTDDSSSDLIFPNKNQLGEETYYVIQAKWFARNNIHKTNHIVKEIKACLTDFSLILSGEKQLSKTNVSFNKQYLKFIEHKNNNKKVKFIFLTLCSPNVNIDEYVDSFENNELVSFELFDLSKLKRNYIEIIYKGIKTHNPIEEPYNPVLNIDLPIKEKRTIRIDKPFKSNIFLIQPRTVFELFNKFGNSIFYKNIRNPLPRSLYNEEIKNTISNNPKYFWYFNNGITAITDKIEDFYSDANKVSMRGLQIINGAQTVYNVYDAFKIATESKRQRMNEDGLITMRVVETGGNDFDLSITRYTNSQNPISERDFHSNDDVQKRLQNDFFKNTNIWYETRQGEFVQKYHNALVLSNELLGQFYLAYFINDPLSAKQKRRYIFLSNKIKPNGLYETIFSEDTQYDDMLIAYHLQLFVDKKRKEFKSFIDKIDTTKKLSKKQKEFLKFDFIQYAGFDILALFKLVLQRFNRDNVSTINKKVIKLFENNQLKFFEDAYDLIINFLLKDLEVRKTKDFKIVNSVLFKNSGYYQDVKISFNKFISKQNLKKLNY
ncbi:MAG: AIPR family protein [Minisyncoccia bacterium]